MSQTLDDDLMAARETPDVARLAEEVGQRLTAIGLAVLVLRREGANPEALSTIEVALREAKRELKRVRPPAGGRRLH